jgi:hypothetical protein
VLSPSTALYDLNTKKAAYERMGVAGDKAFEASSPFAVRVVPSELLGRRRDR